MSTSGLDTRVLGYYPGTLVLRVLSDLQNFGYPLWIQRLAMFKMIK